MEQFPILVVEDSADDTLLLKRALIKAGISNRLFTCKDGREAVCYLSGLGEFSDRKCYPMPGIIITDLKMPQFNGFDLLQWRKQQGPHFFTPIIVLSTSNNHRDLQEAYSMGAASYFAKPNAFDQLVLLLRTIVDYWSIAEIPRRHPEYLP